MFWFTDTLGWEIFGYLASALVIFSLTRTNVKQLWRMNAIGDIATIIYALPKNAIPVVLMNLGALTIDIIQLVRLRRVPTAFNLVTATKGSGYFDWYTQKHENDIKAFDPEERYKEADELFFYVRNDEVAGLLAYNVLDDGTAEIVLDYVAKKFRDVRIGSYFFGSDSPKFAHAGIKTLLTHTKNPAHEGYLRKIGFTHRASGEWVKAI